MSEEDSGVVEKLGINIGHLTNRVTGSARKLVCNTSTTM